MMSQREIELLQARLDLYEAELQEFRAIFGEFANEHLEVLKANQQSTEAQNEFGAVQMRQARQLLCDMVILINVVARLGHIITCNTDVRGNDLLSMLKSIKGDTPREMQESATAFGILESLWGDVANWEAQNRN